MNNGLHCHNILATELAFLEKKYWLLDYVPTRMPKINVVLIFKKNILSTAFFRAASY